MSAFVYHTKASAPEASQQWIPKGFLPNLHAIMAESPFLLEGYKRLWDLARVVVVAARGAGRDDDGELREQLPLLRAVAHIHHEAGQDARRRDRCAAFG